VKEVRGLRLAKKNCARMTILFTSLLSGPAWGGSEELWSRAAVILASRGHRVAASVEGREPRAGRLGLLRASGVEVICRHEERPSVLWRVAGKWKRKEGDAFYVERFRQVIGAVRPDLICLSSGGVVGDVRFLEAALDAGTRVVNISQANAEEWWPNDVNGERCARALGRALACFFVSEGNLRLWETQIAGVLANASVVRNPFNVSYQATPDWPDVDGGMRLACVGRLDPRAKGQDLLFKVIAQPAWRERELTVSLFGQGPMEGMLRRLARSLDLGERVVFGGQVEDIEGIWKSHHGLILPSRYEGLPLALVEAMLCQRMAVVTGVAGNPEVVDEGTSGFIAPSASVKDLAEAMERAWEGRDEWQAMGREAGSRIRKLVPEDPAAEFADQLEAFVSP